MRSSKARLMSASISDLHMSRTSQSAVPFLMASVNSQPGLSDGHLQKPLALMPYD